TEEELLTVFKPELDGEDIEEIRNWYNGYSFCGEKVYNPFDVLLYLSERQFKPYWFETGTPEFLIKLILDKRFYIPELENLTATDDLVGSFDIDFIEPEPILFQTGYLTIKECESSFDGVLYYLSYPNREVKISLNRYLIRYFTQNSRVIDQTIQLRKIFKEGDVQQFQKVLKSLFASIPNDWYRKNKLSEYEGYYASVVYSFLASTGLTLIAEDTTNKGRIDLTVIYDDKAYIIEFKVIEIDEEETPALKQIEEKRYYEKYIGKYKDIYLVGIEFSREQRNIRSFEWKKV
ncbi:MAG: PD-(D/E)XK nuclease domain-containing protein, partial [Candidatus Aenigmatarchaeota archaeon]